MESSANLSQCPNCAGESPAVDSRLGEIARCIQCGEFFVQSDRRFENPIDKDFELQNAESQDHNSLRRYAGVGSGFVSILVHAAAFLVLSYVCFFDVDEDRNELVVVISDREEQPEENVVLTSTQPLLESMEVEGDVAAASTVAVQPTRTMADVELKIPDGFEIGQPSIGNGVGGHGHGGMFDGAAGAESVAFVIDASVSMRGGRMERALEQLFDSIRSLNEDQSFFLVFFNKKTYPMMWPAIERRLIPATEYNKERVIYWAKHVVPDNNTQPQNALRMALKLKPQLLYFLTDGEIPDSTIDIAKDHCTRVTRMNSVQISDVPFFVVQEKDLNPLLAEIAQIGGGTYRIVY